MKPLQSLRHHVATIPALEPFVTEVRARKLAVREKRLDLCAAQAAKMFHLAHAEPIEGRTCAEIGCGVVLSHSLVLHLLGAKRVIATDIARVASLQALVESARHAVSGVVRDVLGCFVRDSLLRERLSRFLREPPRTLGDLERLGIEYLAPLDLARERLPTTDLIYSNAVLEHVPVVDLPVVLGGLAESLAPGGFMLHSVHLEDHADLVKNPFAFLALSQGAFGASEGARGNRLRFSRWQRLLSSLPDVEADYLYVQLREEAPLPSRIDGSIDHEGERDLRTSHFGVCLRKQGTSHSERTLHSDPALIR